MLCQEKSGNPGTKLTIPQYRHNGGKQLLEFPISFFTPKKKVFIGS
jgi:hypothetical protein